MKIITSIKYAFEIESEILTDLDFTLDVSIETIKTKTKVTEVKLSRKYKNKKDESSRLF